MDYKKDDGFMYAIDTILKHEGSRYVNHPNDPGGETKYGISKRSYPHLDIKNLTVEDAKAIYYKDFWRKGKYYRIRDKKVATKIFDMSVNMGRKQAGKIAQRACNAAGHKLAVDGILGNKSFEAINSTNPDVMIAVLRAEQWAYYRIIMTRNKRLRVFKNGWKRRAYS